MQRRERHIALEIGQNLAINQYRPIMASFSQAPAVRIAVTTSGTFSGVYD